MMKILIIGGLLFSLFSCQKEYLDYLTLIDTQMKMTLKTNEQEDKMEKQFISFIQEGRAALQTQEWNKVELCLLGGEKMMNHYLPQTLLDQYFRLKMAYYDIKNEKESLLRVVQQAKEWIHNPIIDFYELSEARIFYYLGDFKEALTRYHHLIRDCLEQFTIEDYYILGILLAEKYEEFNPEEWAHFIKNKGPFNHLWAQYLIEYLINIGDTEKILLYWCELFLYELEIGKIIYSETFFEKVFPKNICSEVEKELIKEWFSEKGLHSSNWEELKLIFKKSEFLNYLNVMQMMDDEVEVEDVLPLLVSLEEFYYSFPSYYYYCLKCFSKLSQLPKEESLYPMMIKALETTQKGCLNNDCQEIIRQLSKRDKEEKEHEE